MSKKYLLLILFFIGVSISHGQSDLNIFGFYQVRVQKIDGNYQVKGNVPTPAGPQEMVFDEAKNDFTNPAVQQLNLFFRKQITNSLSSFVNLELVNNFSTQNDWGYMNLQEAWVQYRHNDALKIKAGMMIPRFNYLNEIKNRMPLLPYITRPLIYESSLSEIIDPTVYLPERAFIQIAGVLPVDQFVFDYAIYSGPAERDYILSGNEANNGAITSGVDSTNFFLLGGRVGFSYSNLRLGFSATIDKSNQQEQLNEDVSRTRIGADFGYAHSNFFVEGEYINVMLDPKNTEDDIDKHFYYGLLGYNFSEEIYGFATYSSIEDKQVEFLSTGMDSWAAGIGYKPTPMVVLKLEYANYYVSDNASVNIPIDPNLPPVEADMELDFKSVNLALSVIF